MRISSALAAMLLLAACSKGADGQATSGGSSGETAKGDAPIACALGGAKDFADDCTLERGTQDGAPTLLIRHPDGGFRRFVLKDGGIATADGAETAQVVGQGGTTDVTVGNDRYRIPALAVGHATKP